MEPEHVVDAVTPFAAFVEWGVEQYGKLYKQPQPVEVHPLVKRFASTLSLYGFHVRRIYPRGDLLAVTFLSKKPPWYDDDLLPTHESDHDKAEVWDGSLQLKRMKHLIQEFYARYPKATPYRRSRVQIAVSKAHELEIDDEMVVSYWVGPSYSEAGTQERSSAEQHLSDFVDFLNRWLYEYRAQQKLHIQRH